MNSPGGNGAARRPIVLYDGGCVSCRRSAGLLARLDRGRRVARLDMTAPSAGPLLSTMTPRRRGRSVHLVQTDGRVLHGGAAVRAAVRAARPGAVGRLLTCGPLAALLDHGYGPAAALRRPLRWPTGWLSDPPADDLLPSDWPLPAAFWTDPAGE